jgi:hypothetical protein
MGKLCTNEVKEIKMEKNEKKKKKCFAIQKTYFLYGSFFLATPLALHFQDDL